MPRPLKFGRIKQSSEGQKTDKPRLLPSPAFTGAVTPGTAESSSNLIPPPRFPGDSTPGTAELPRTLDIGGFLYERVDVNYRGDATMAMNGYQGGPSPASMLRELGSPNESPELKSEPTPQTLQPTTTASSPPALRKPKRGSNMLRELEGYNKSPEPDSDFEQESLRPKTARLSKSKPLGEPLMLREIAAHNLSPEPDSEPGVRTICNLMQNWRGARLTRSASRDIENFVKGKPPVPRKNLNVETLMLAEFSGIEKGTKKFYAEDSIKLEASSYKRQPEFRMETDFLDEEENEEEDLPKKWRTNDRSHRQRILTRGKLPRRVESIMENGQQTQKLVAKSARLTWDNQKGRINEIVKSPRYNPHPSQQELGVQGRKKPAYHATAEVPEGFEGAFHMEEGLYVFTPTAAAFSDFCRFLKDVEEIAGRKMGVVKIIVPSECLGQTPSLGRGKLPKSPVIKTMKVTMSLANDDEEDPSKVYNIFTSNDSTSLEADEWLSMIQGDKDSIIKKRAISAEAISRNDVWKESHMLRPYPERRMIRRGQKQDGAVTCALNEPATPRLRAALKYRDPNIENFFGNRFASSRSTQPGINQSVFHIVGGPGPLSPLQMNKYAAYSLNYHHSGAPRTLTVTLPEHHAKLEEAIHATQKSGNTSGRPRKPPTCSQFVGHQKMYMPHATLSVYDVDYTEVVQHQGEMVITFPYAYHQAYASGPNITEEILYASDRCKVFHRESLYQHCSRKCAIEQPDDFDLKGVFSNTLSSSRSGRVRRSGLEPPSLFLSQSQSPEASASQERGPNGGPSKRMSGLKAMDRFSDDGDWIEPSAELSRLQPMKQRKATDMTSNPYKPDIWDPIHAFNDSHCPADDDDGSPIGGIRPRDLATGRLLMPHEWRASKRKHDKESDEAPRKHSHRH